MQRKNNRFSQRKKSFYSDDIFFSFHPFFIPFLIEIILLCFACNLFWHTVEKNIIFFVVIFSQVSLTKDSFSSNSNVWFNNKNTA